MALGPDEYIFTQDNDVLGFMNEDLSGAIGYDWMDPSQQDLPKPYAVSIEEGDLPQVGMVVQFSSFGLPYEFGIGARYDQSTSSRFPQTFYLDLSPDSS